VPHLDVPGATLYYETEGHISSPAVLLIHAGVATLRMWDPLAASLAESHFVVRFDTRGFGQTVSDNVAYSDRQDVRDILDHLGVPRATLIGSSRGGGIAIDVAVETPERAAGVVTIGSGPSGFPDTPLTGREDALFERIDDVSDVGDWHLLSHLEAEVWTLGPERAADDLDPAFVELAYALNRPNAAHGDDAPIAAPLSPPAYGRVADLDVPFLSVVGEFDVSAALAEHAYLVDTIPKAEGYVFRDAAHLPSVEHPDEFERIVTEWMARHRL
jgi:3-oxoadipate enol-lactonase